MARGGRPPKIVVKDIGKGQAWAEPWGYERGLIFNETLLGSSAHLQRLKRPI